MNKIIKYGAIALVAVLAIFGVTKLFSSSNLAGGASTAFPNGLSIGGGTYDAGTSLGLTGTTFTQMNGGVCYIKAYATTIAASSSATVDCQATALVDQSSGRIGSALTGVKVGDSIVASLSTTTTGVTGGGLDIAGVSASTTAGYIVIQIANQTGATYTWPTSGAATGTVQYFSFR